MVLAGMLFVAVTVTVRHLGSDMPAVEAAFIRYVFGLVLLTPVLLRIRWRRITAKNARLYLFRGLVHGLAVMLWFYAMARIPIAEVTAIGYTTPIFTSIGAIVLFGERIHFRRFMAIVIGFIGTLIILRPGVVSIEIGSLAQLVAAPCFAASFLLAKKLTNTEQSSDILAMLSIFCTLALLPGALMQWRTPEVSELGWLLLVAIIATAGHYALTRSFAHAPLTVTQPYAFLQLVWALAFGYLIAAVTYLTHREAMAARRALLESSQAP